MPSIKELKELLKVLRANGVTSYQSGDTKIELLPENKKLGSAEPTSENIPTDKLYTDEQLMTWSGSALDESQ